MHARNLVRELSSLLVTHVLTYPHTRCCEFRWAEVIGVSTRSSCITPSKQYTNGGDKVHCALSLSLAASLLSLWTSFPIILIHFLLFSLPFVFFSSCSVSPHTCYFCFLVDLRAPPTAASKRQFPTEWKEIKLTISHFYLNKYVNIPVKHKWFLSWWLKSEQRPCNFTNLGFRSTKVSLNPTCNKMFKAV